MLDPDEMAAYEAWKFNRLENGVDISVKAYNDEMGRQAVAWDEAIAHLVAAGAIDSETASLAEAANPHRQPGMRGHTPHAHPVVSPAGPPAPPAPSITK